MAEIDKIHDERARAIVQEVGTPFPEDEEAVYLAAYQAVLLKEVLWCLSELLAYKQAQVHQ